jgi:Ca2+/Na+ antiporter
MITIMRTMMIMTMMMMVMVADILDILYYYYYYYYYYYIIIIIKKSNGRNERMAGKPKCCSGYHRSQTWLPQSQTRATTVGSQQLTAWATIRSIYFSACRKIHLSWNPHCVFPANPNPTAFCHRGSLNEVGCHTSSFITVCLRAQNIYGRANLGFKVK